MAWRLEKFVEHGEIDNTVSGSTTGRIWLCGMEEPLLLELDGDCWRDLAGAKLEFTNPAPQSGLNLETLDPDQVGLVGDMTAALRVTHGGRKHAPEARWNNALYLEWFSEANGRVLIESTQYKLRISSRVWHMDEDEEQAQKLANLQAMRDFMARMIGRGEMNGKSSSKTARGDSEDALLQHSERVSRAFGEVLEKYGEDPESERKEAFVMGWDRKLEALADREEAMNLRMPPPNFSEGEAQGEEDPGADWANLMEGDEADFDDEEFYCDEEPIVEKARELCLRAMEIVDHESEAGTPEAQLSSSLLEVSSKLAAAFENDDDDAESMATILNILKRCLSWINESLNATQVLLNSEKDAVRRDNLEDLTAGIFSVRDDIVELSRDIREEM